MAGANRLKPDLPVWSDRTRHAHRCVEAETCGDAGGVVCDAEEWRLDYQEEITALEPPTHLALTLSGGSLGASPPETAPPFATPRHGRHVD